MTKMMFLAASLLAGALSCASGSKKSQEQTNNVTCADASCPLHKPGASNTVTTDLIAEENWQFNLQGDGWVSLNSPDDTIKVVFTNKTLNMVIFFAKDPTQQSSAEYIINALRSFKSAGTTIAAAKQLTVNDNNFIFVDARGTAREIWTWITVKNGAGYVFTCAAQEQNDGTTAQELCQNTANSLQIK